VEGWLQALILTMSEDIGSVQIEHNSGVGGMAVTPTIRNSSRDRRAGMSVEAGGSLWS
jgi:hypothetical protein